MRIEPYRAGDREAVRRICVLTSWLGELDPARIPDDWIWAEYWTRYFTDRAPDHCWVVRDDHGEVQGYLTGTDDVRRFQRYTLRLMPGLVAHAVRHRLLRERLSRGAIKSQLRSLLGRDMALPRGLKRTHPATCHFNLLPEARGQGLGRKLLKQFFAALRGADVTGVHVQNNSLNQHAAGLLESCGFRLEARRETRAYAHCDEQQIFVCTWVREL